MKNRWYEFMSAIMDIIIQTNTCTKKNQADIMPHIMFWWTGSRNIILSKKLASLFSKKLANFNYKGTWNLFLNHDHGVL